MEALLIIVHIIVCLFLVTIVLLQHGKGADVGATFGGSSNTVFGTEGPLPLLNKITTGAAILFMVTSISLAYISANLKSGSVMEDMEINKPAPIQQAPAPTEKPETDSDTVPLPSADAVDSSDKAPAQFPGSSSNDTEQQKGGASSAGTESEK